MFVFCRPVRIRGDSITWQLVHIQNIISNHNKMENIDDWRLLWHTEAGIKLGFDVCQTQVGVPARPSPDHVLKQRQRRFANCYNCSAWRHHGYVSDSGILSCRHNRSEYFSTLSWKHTDSEGHTVALLHWWDFCRDSKSSLCIGYQECTRRRMVSGTSPSLPYVCRYDTVEDVMQQREKIPEKNEGESTSSACALQPSLSAAVFPCVLLPTLSFLSAAEQKKKASFLQTVPGSSNASSFVCCSSQALFLWQFALIPGPLCAKLKALLSP